LTDWKKIEAEAELIKQKVNNKKTPVSLHGKAPPPLQKAKSKPEPLKESK